MNEEQTQTIEPAVELTQDDRWEALQGSMTAAAPGDEIEVQLDAQTAVEDEAEAEPAAPEPEAEKPETKPDEEPGPDLSSFMTTAKEIFGVEEFTVKAPDGKEITGLEAFTAMLPEVKLLSDISKQFESGPDGARKALETLVMSAVEKYPAEDLREEWEAFDALDLENLSPEGRVFAGALQLSLEAKNQLEARIEELRRVNVDLVEETRLYKNAPNLAKLVKDFDGRSNLTGDEVLALMKKHNQTDPVNAYIIEKRKSGQASGKPEGSDEKAEPETPRLAGIGRPTGKVYDPDAKNDKGDPLYSIEEMMRLERSGYAAVPGSQKSKK